MQLISNEDLEKLSTKTINHLIDIIKEIEKELGYTTYILSETLNSLYDELDSDIPLF